MKRILIVVATEQEAAFLRQMETGKTNPFQLRNPGNQHFDVIITGAGILATTFQLTHHLAYHQYDLAINIGICGSLDKKLKPVKLVRIIKDQFGDFGADDNGKFLDAMQIGLLDGDQKPYKKGKLFPSSPKGLKCLNILEEREGITVQKSHGSNKEASLVHKKYGQVMESMEGAAFFYVCMMNSIPCIQVRAISNIVEKRNKKAWKIKEAIDALSGFTSLLLMELESLATEQPVKVKNKR